MTRLALVAVVVIALAHGARAQEPRDPLLERLDSPDGEECRDALAELAATGSAVPAAVSSRLVELLADHAIGHQAASALARVDRVALRRAATDHPEPKGREHALDALPLDDPTTPAVLASAAADPAQSIRPTLAALNRLNDLPVSDDVVRGLVGALDNSRSSMRSHALRSLRRVGPGHPGAVAALLAQVRDGCHGPGDPHRIAEAFGCVAPVGSSAVAELVELATRRYGSSTSHCGSETTECALAALSELGREVLPPVREALEGRGRLSKTAAIELLAEIARHDADLRGELDRALVEGLGDSRASIRETAALVVGRDARDGLPVPAPPVVVALACAIEDEHGSVRSASAAAWSALAPALQQAGALPDASIVARVYARRALGLALAVGAWLAASWLVARRRAPGVGVRLVAALAPATVTAVVVHRALSVPWAIDALPATPGTLVSAPAAVAASAGFLVLLAALLALRPASRETREL